MHHTYRPEIDGLRTVAVVPVVLFHAGVGALSGGYVGVDIFFVISGFLITRILLSNLESGFDLWDFYKRRIRRILPALLAVLLFATIAGIVILTPSALAEYGKSMIGVSLFGSNFFFWKSVDYFSSQAHVQPLLHTWSLAVEEQYYIFYPLLLFVLHRWRVPLVPVLAILGLMSFLAAAVLVSSMPGAVFYLLPFRAWELTLGGLVAVIPALASRSLVARMVAPLGLVLIALPFFLYTPETTFPGLAAAPPVVGTALIIWAGDRPGTWLFRILASRPFVAVGQASYSFYLWHFPLFAYASYLLDRPLDALTGSVLSVVALAAAFASLRWIETPVRRSNSAASVFVPLGLLVAALGIGAALAASAGWPQRLPAEARLLADAPGDKFRHPYHCMSVNQTIVAPEQACRLGAPGMEPRVLLWGDSHAMVTATAMNAAARRTNSAFLFAATADCPPGLGFSVSERSEPGLTRMPSYRFCADYNRRMYELAIHDDQIDTVVISARWSNWRIGEPGNRVEAPADIRLEDETGIATSVEGNRAIFERGFLALVRALTGSGKTVYLVGPIPEPPFDVPQSLYVARWGLAEVPEALRVDDFRRRHAVAFQILAEAARIPGAQLIEPHVSLCSPSSCPIADTDGSPTYFDHNHLSVRAARNLSPLFVPVFRVRDDQAVDARPVAAQTVR